LCRTHPQHAALRPVIRRGHSGILFIDSRSRCKAVWIKASTAARIGGVRAGQASSTRARSGSAATSAPDSAPPRAEGAGFPGEFAVGSIPIHSRYVTPSRSTSKTDGPGELLRGVAGAAVFRDAFRPQRVSDAVRTGRTGAVAPARAWSV